MTTKIELARVDNDFLMEAQNEVGRKILLDASSANGGHDSAMRPMQLLLAAMGGCSAIDVITILRKQHQHIEDIKITVTGDRQDGVEPSLYTSVHAHYKLYGNIQNDKAERAISLSVNKYCSVAKTLEQSAKITFSWEIINHI